MNNQIIQAVEEADSSQGLIDAVKDLAAAQIEDAIPILIKVLGYNNPGAAVAAVDGLVLLGVRAVLPLLEKLDGYNYGARAWAIRALAGIGDPRGLDLLLDAAINDFSFSVRRGAAKGLGFIDWKKLPESQIFDSQLSTMKTLLQVSQDQEWIVRYAAVVGLYGLAKTVEVTYPKWLEDILTRFEEIVDTDTTLAVSARAQMAIADLGRERKSEVESDILIT
ncbi:HEAT repeat domain-containing protein [Okeania hirsuta]|uniref:HEAT repeat domain-containing protein n=1 Tax=Okeania hirsuta TaxID=1458930 RepID=A0A3N6RG56_9CYAN|nr:HEAT repeat domain-containing protein [Okeania sp. SIO2B9]NET75391.1 HEAT repeat domain-containing protein [Okeania sp. SIO1F9]RQH13381.1 HEAT repeat domain-containing protein [Okeania hirsuta]RQH42263.1 HEAT repeat domain-containing protein [Okeania hirsuta]